MTRRRLAQAAAAFAPALGRWGATAAQNIPPNIVIILADELGYGDLSCYGHPTISTPYLDRMGAEGMRFTQFYSASSVCSPSRAAVLTGRLPIRAGIVSSLMPWACGGLPSGEVTIAAALKQSGYATACVGKWHLGHQPKYLPTRHGFERFFGIPYSTDMSQATAAYPPFVQLLQQHPEVPGTPLMRNEEVVETEPDQRTLTRRYTEESISFIRDSLRRGQPFFLYLPHTFAHVPLFASDAFRGKSLRGLYGDVVEEMDWSVGEIRKTLAEQGADRNTLMLFTSADGPWLLQKQDGGSAGPLRGGKGTTWEGGMRVPCLAAWPGRIPTGIVSHAFGTTMDLLPTCLRLAGVPLPTGREYDGADLCPVLFDGRSGRDPLLFYYSKDDLRAVRVGPWKLHVATTSPDDAVVRHTRPLLYNVDEDPSEQYDVAASHPGVVTDLMAVMEEHRRGVKPGPPQG
ncbi:MAG: sulfatase [Bryobacteraceae bacterium]|jgi:arylsulfatase A-like enzyme